MENMPDPEVQPNAITEPPPAPASPEFPFRMQYAITESPFPPHGLFTYLRPPPHNVGWFVEASEWELLSTERSERNTPHGGKERTLVAVWNREVSFDPAIHQDEPEYLAAEISEPPAPVSASIPYAGAGPRPVPGQAVPSRQFLPQNGAGQRPTGNPRDTAPSAPGSSVAQRPVVQMTHAPTFGGVQVIVHDRGRQPLPGESPEGMGG